MYYIYTILNKVNYKFYVGQTQRPENRWSAHKCEANSERAYLPIHKAIRKYGSTSFQFCIIEVVSSQEEANMSEEFWIQALNSRSDEGYNLAIGGSGNSGWHHTEDSKMKISSAQKGVARRPRTEEEKSKTSLSMMGHKVSSEVKEKISLTQKGKPRWTEEQKQQMSISRRGRKVSEETKRKMSEAKRKKRSS